MDWKGKRSRTTIKALERQAAEMSEETRIGRMKGVCVHVGFVGGVGQGGRYLIQKQV